VAHALRRNGIDAAALREWHEGAFLGRRDEDILAAALNEDRVFVTYDLRTIPPMLKRFAVQGALHAGVILVNVGTILPGDVRRLTRSLGRLAKEQEGLRNQVLFLTK